MKNEMLETYCRQIKAFPLLSFEEERELSKRIRQGKGEGERQAALHKLVNCNLRLVVKIAGLFSAPGIPFLDIIQEGNVGLIRAAEKYDHQKNVRFCTYASWWIRECIRRFVCGKQGIINLPLRKEKMLRKIKKTYSILCQALNHPPQNTDIAEALGIPVGDVDMILHLTAGAREYIDSEGMDIYEDYTYSPEPAVLKQFSRDSALGILNKLKGQEKRILTYRYQLNGCERHTLKEIGAKLDISAETVRQIEMKALQKIRAHASELKECLYG